MMMTTTTTTTTIIIIIQTHSGIASFFDAQGKNYTDGARQTLQTLKEIV
jgi:hypothetical protein